METLSKLIVFSVISNVVLYFGLVAIGQANLFAAITLFTYGVF
jgi:hypothetical protein